MITPIQLKELTGIQDITRLTDFTNGINDSISKFQINTTLRMQHFLAQVFHESSNLQLLQENLNYSANGLLGVFHKYFLTEDVAKQYERQPDKIANHVYANRMGNGDEASGDGSKYKGRGAIQLTGKDNYELLSKATGVDFLTHPEFLEEPKYAILSAAWFWSRNGFNELADKNDIETITKKINGGLLGLDDRKAKFEKIKTIIT